MIMHRVISRRCDKMMNTVVVKRSRLRGPIELNGLHHVGYSMNVSVFYSRIEAVARYGRDRK